MDASVENTVGGAEGEAGIRCGLHPQGLIPQRLGDKSKMLKVKSKFVLKYEYAQNSKQREAWVEGGLRERSRT